MNDIEFELIQGAISRDDLGQGIQAVKKHQSKVRREVFDRVGEDVSWQEVASKQFQINDMLITLLQEVAANNRELAQSFERFGKRRRSLEQLTAEEQVRFFQQQTQLSSVEEDRSTENIKSAMSAETLQMKLAVQASNVPIIGSFVNRIKVGLHNLVLFYLQHFAKKQAAVNQTYGDWLLYLNSLHRHQQEELEILREELIRLQDLAENSNSLSTPGQDG